MTFRKRLLYYLIGFGLGLFLVFAFILRNKKIDFWTPSGMIKSRIAEKPFSTTPKADCQLKCLKLYPDFVLMKVQDASIKFEPGKEIKQQCKTYTMTHKGTTMVFKICPNEVFLESITELGDSCKCD
jgi:hypothetical protein